LGRWYDLSKRARKRLETAISREIKELTKMTTTTTTNEASVRACLALDAAYRLAEINAIAAIDILCWAHKAETDYYYNYWSVDDDGSDGDERRFVAAVDAQRLLSSPLQEFDELRFVQSYIRW
jgi:hypothetical protein